MIFFFAFDIFSQFYEFYISTRQIFKDKRSFWEKMLNVSVTFVYNLKPPIFEVTAI